MFGLLMLCVAGLNGHIIRVSKFAERLFFDCFHVGNESTDEIDCRSGSSCDIAGEGETDGVGNLLWIQLEQGDCCLMIGKKEREREHKV